MYVCWVYVALETGPRASSMVGKCSINYYTQDRKVPLKTEGICLIIWSRTPFSLICSKPQGGTLCFNCSSHFSILYHIWPQESTKLAVEKLLLLLPRVDEISQRDEKHFTGGNPIPQEVTVHSQQISGRVELPCAVVSTALCHSWASIFRETPSLAHQPFVFYPGVKEGSPQKEHLNQC